MYLSRLVEASLSEVSPSMGEEPKVNFPLGIIKFILNFDYKKVPLITTVRVLPKTDGRNLR